MTVDYTNLYETISRIAIAARATGSDPEVPSEDRPYLIACIERALIDWDALNQYGSTAEQAIMSIAGEPRLDTRWDDADTEAILDRGLEVLDNRALASLALESYRVVGLHEEIEDQFRPAWVAAMRAHVEERCDLYGRRSHPKVGLSREQPVPPVVLHDPFPGPAFVGSDMAYALGGRDEGPPTEGSARERARRRWRFLKQAEDWTWLEGNPAEASGHPGEVLVEWIPAEAGDAGGRLVLNVMGFLRAGRGAVTEVRWSRSDGTLLATATVADSYDEVPIRGGPASGPAAGDRLEIRNCWTIPGAPGWDVRTSFAF